MAIRLVVAITDSDWFDSLRVRPNLPEVNFWAPGGSPFKALQFGELFLFKLHAPRNFIVGGGVYAYSNTLPCSLAWEAFGELNGAPTLSAMRTRIQKYRRADPTDRSDFMIGCRVLTQPFFLNESDWIPVPEDWSMNIVTFKTYSTDEQTGLKLWQSVSAAMAAKDTAVAPTIAPRYGEPVLVKPRLGQGAFRILVTDIYHRKCAVTGEKTLPALEAAHIRPYADGGEHAPTNGLLMRRDLHSLFDAGYVTITPEFRFEVSPKIREEYENGRHYYALHGQKITVPENPAHLPNKAALQWHNEDRFRP